MKLYGPIFAAGILAASSAAQADLYFSEYIEGSSLNKALEIINTTGSSVDLSGYQVQIYFNGNTSAGATFNLSGTLDDGNVFVIADDGADGDILAAADLTPGNSFFNGDDAIILLNNGEVVDAFGQIGVDPGSAWTGNGVSAQNRTLRRSDSVTTGDVNAYDAFDPSVEWIEFPQDSFDDLGNGGGGTVPEPTYTYIHEIQGDAAETPLDGQTVIVEAIVIGDFQNNGGADNGELGGFYVQEEDADTDGNPLTSEGLFVYDGNGSVDVVVGDKVQVSGTAGEYYGMTRISASSVTVVGSGESLPTATIINLPVAATNDFEAVEGMLTTFPQQLVISEYYNFGRYGEVVLAQPLDGEQRPMTATAVEQPGTAGYEARALENSLSRITLDDGRTSQNPDPAIHPNGQVFDLGNRFRGGDIVQGAYGILDYRYSKYRIQPTLGANYIAANPRSPVPFLGSDLKVASFNVLNYFTTLDQNGNQCGPNLDLGCRGADNEEEFQRQRAKIIQAIAELDADVVGLIEIENNDVEAVEDLVNGLNDLLGMGTYASVDTGYIGTDTIRVAFIYQPESVATMGDYAILDESVDPLFVESKNRPALAQTFVDKSNAGRFTVAVNHLKSKGSDCDELGDPDMNDGQGNCNLTRRDAATALVNWMNGNPTGYGDGDYLIIGDLNAYDKEDPIAAITAEGYVDLLARDQGEYAYTYVFDGQYGYLDHALANTGMADQAIANVWHINADEPNILDYDTSYKQAAQDGLYEANAYRSSDHDPVLVGLNLDASIADILAYAKYAEANGSLTGAGVKPGLKTGLFVRLIKQAERFEQRRNSRVSCVLLGLAERFSDGYSSPVKDIVTGPDGPTVSAMISSYTDDNCF